METGNGQMVHDPRAAYRNLQSKIIDLDPLQVLVVYGSMTMVQPNDEGRLIRRQLAQAQSELLQALLLRHKLDEFSNRRATEQDLDEVTELLGEIAQDAARSRQQTAQPIAGPDGEHYRALLANVQLHTQLVRHTGYPQHIVAVCKEMFRAYDANMALKRGVRLSDLIEMIDAIILRIQRSFHEVASLTYEVQDFSEFCASIDSFIGIFPDASVGLGDLKTWGASRPTSELSLALSEFLNSQWVKAFTVEDSEFQQLYPSPVALDDLIAVINLWSAEFGQLSDENPDHFILTNPVLRAPIVRLAPGRYLFPTPWTIMYSLRELIEAVINLEPDIRSSYIDASGKGDDFEEVVERLFREGFPREEIHTNSYILDASGGEVGESDVLVLVDTHAIIAEAKTETISDAARRGAIKSFENALTESYVCSIEQATKFRDYLESGFQINNIKKRDGSLMKVNVTDVNHYVMLALSWSRLGSVQSDIYCIPNSLISPAIKEVVPLITSYELAACFGVLEFECQRLHYLIKRRLMDAVTNHLSKEGEMALIEQYLLDGLFLDSHRDYRANPLRLLDDVDIVSDYFYGKWLRLPRDKPQMRLTPFWRSLLQDLEEGRERGWTKASIALLETSLADQELLEHEIDEARERINASRRPNHEIVYIRIGGPTVQPINIIAIVYRGYYFWQVNERLKKEATLLLGHFRDDFAVVIGVDADLPDQGFSFIGSAS